MSGKTYYTSSKPVSALFHNLLGFYNVWSLEFMPISLASNFAIIGWKTNLGYNTLTCSVIESTP